MSMDLVTLMSQVGRGLDPYPPTVHEPFFCGLNKGFCIFGSQIKVVLKAIPWMSIDLVTDIWVHNVQDLHPSKVEDLWINFSKLFRRRSSHYILLGCYSWRPERQVVRRETDWYTHKEPYQRASMVLPATTMYCHSKGSRQLATAMRLSAINIKISLFKLIIWLTVFWLYFYTNKLSHLC